MFFLLVIFWPQVEGEGEGKIQISDLCFIKCGPQPIQLPLGLYSEQC